MHQKEFMQIICKCGTKVAEDWVINEITGQPQVKRFDGIRLFKKIGLTMYQDHTCAHWSNPKII